MSALFRSASEWDAPQFDDANDDQEGRPRTRAECPSGPCPWYGCRHHVGLDLRGDRVHLVVDPDDVTEETPTCSLTLAERGGMTLEDVGQVMGVTRERIRQVEARALAKVRRRAGWNGPARRLAEFLDTNPGEAGPDLPKQETFEAKFLAAVQATPGQSAGELAARVGSAKSTGHKTLDQLRVAGFVFASRAVGNRWEWFPDGHPGPLSLQDRVRAALRLEAGEAAAIAMRAGCSLSAVWKHLNDLTEEGAAERHDDIKPNRWSLPGGHKPAPKIAPEEIKTMTDKKRERYNLLIGIVKTGPGLKASEICKLTGIPESTCRQALNELVDLGTLYTEGAGDNPDPKRFFPVMERKPYAKEATPVGLPEEPSGDSGELPRKAMRQTKPGYKPASTEAGVRGAKPTIAIASPTGRQPRMLEQMAAREEVGRRALKDFAEGIERAQMTPAQFEEQYDRRYDAAIEGTRSAGLRFGQRRTISEHDVTLIGTDQEIGHMSALLQAYRYGGWASVLELAAREVDRGAA